MACYARFSLPALLAPLPFKTSLSSLPAALTVSKHPEWVPQAIAGAEWRRTSLLRVRVMATDASPEEAVPRSVPVRVAHELLQAGHRYLDVRTVDEFNAGRPVGSTNVPYMFKDGAGMTKNPNFLAEVSSAFGKDDEIIVGCQSGKRSLMAAADLSSAVIEALRSDISLPDNPSPDNLTENSILPPQRGTSSGSQVGPARRHHQPEQLPGRELRSLSEGRRVDIRPYLAHLRTELL